MSGMIRKFGWTVEYIYAGDCEVPGCTCPDAAIPFAYTIGMFGYGHPELLVLGMPVDSAHPVLNELGQRVKDGEQLLPGQLITFPNWPHRMVPGVVPNPGEIVFGANRHYQRPAEFSVPVLQLSYDDRDGRFPWEPGYAAPHLQPRPGNFRA